MNYPIIDSGGPFSGYITRLTMMAESACVTVHIYADLPEGVAGIFRSQTSEIFISEPSARAALMTLAHEIGHWIGWRVRVKLTSPQRERQAFVYGWQTLQSVGAGDVLTREDWNRFHREAREIRDAA